MSSRKPHPDERNLYAEVLLPLPLPGTFTYRVPPEFRGGITSGCRVVVPFGKRKIYTGIVFRLHHRPPAGFEARPVLELLETTPSINRIQLDFFRWLAGYYLCTPGEVLQAALPSGLKIDTTSLVQLHPQFRPGQQVLSLEEQIVISHLSEQELIETRQLEERTGIRNLARVLKELAGKGAILLVDHIKERYVPRRQKFVRICRKLAASEEALAGVLNSLEKKPRQLEVLLRYLQEVALPEAQEKNETGLPLARLTEAGCSPSSIKTLTRHGVLEVVEREVSRFPDTGRPEPPRPLSAGQQKAREALLQEMSRHPAVLLHGITGSGKTEIYIDLIRQTLENGHQVLYLLPEIALTTQIVTRLQKVFGNRMGVYHSRYPANERVEVWRQLMARKINLVVGVRSAVFLPFSDLGLIIVDEEHEPSYKQYEPAPRYHARDAALMLARLHHARVLLGSATPALETYYLATTGKYGYVALAERYGTSVLPRVEVIDLVRAHKKKQMQGHFSHQLVAAMEETLSQGERVIIFQNRRGYAPLLSCRACGWVPQCRHCDVSLTYHQYRQELRCHYCGFKEELPTACPACHTTDIRTVSYGTEQLEEELRLLFPEQQVGRLDLDTARGRQSYERIIRDFGEGRTRILVGTQMVAKGLDFNKVGLVGIVNLDRMLYFPDFRATERAFQLAVQVAGRAGRQDKQGLVLIQTFNPGQPLVALIRQQDYQAFYRFEITERQAFHYPPFSRIIKLTLRHRDHRLAEEAARTLTDRLTHQLPAGRVLGPVVPAVPRIRDHYLRYLYLKTDRNRNPEQTKKILLQTIQSLNSRPDFRKVEVTVDVDPV